MKYPDMFNFDDRTRSVLSKWDIDQIEFANALGMSYFNTRITQIGLTNHATVLDLACGIGHWSIAMSYHNQNVVAADASPGRLKLLGMAASTRKISNISPIRLTMAQLPFHDASFDAVACIGALMFTNVERSIGEMARVLKPNGLLWLHVNTPAWWIRELMKGITHFNRNKVLAAISGLGYACGPFTVQPTSAHKMHSLFTKHKFSVLHDGPDGSTGATASHLPYYPDQNEFFNKATINEYLVKKL